MPGRYGGQPVEMKNPFTGKVRAGLSGQPLTPAEVTAVEDVLKRATPGGSDEYGCYVVRLPDGGVAEVHAEDISRSMLVALRGLTEGLLQFLMDLLKAGNWVMIPAMEDTMAVTCSPGSLMGLPEDFPKVVVCNSTAELEGLLLKGFREFKKLLERIRRARH
jgi:hypothetical protein